jgi:hypothetical protein
LATSKPVIELLPPESVEEEGSVNLDHPRRRDGGGRFGKTAQHRRPYGQPFRVYLYTPADEDRKDSFACPLWSRRMTTRRLLPRKLESAVPQSRRALTVRDLASQPPAPPAFAGPLQSADWAKRRGPGLRPEHDSAGCRRRDDLEAMLWSAAAQIRPKGGRTVSVETTIPALPSRLGHRPSGSECIE